MSLRPVVAATTFALILSALVPTAAATAVDNATSVTAGTSAKPKAPKVTIKNLASSSEVGRKVKVTGTAKPGRSGKVKVKVQRRYGAGAWSTVATKTTNKKGRYAVRVPLAQGGPTSFRVKRAGGGKSKIETLAVYEWLYLADQPFLLGLGGGSTRITSVMGGRSFPESIELWTNNLVGLWSVAGCTTVDFWAGFTDRGRDQLDPADHVELRFGPLTATGGEGTITEENIPIGPGVHHTVPVTSETRYFGFALSADTETSEPSADAVIGTPRARCNASALPSVRFEETPLFGARAVR
ncbi:hypothetical protein [Nocardioides sp. W7]|uniref:hypothetical protein n=1 Tax=Nocardioides sp. W7 TaxID=2931390 RepID=UPI001FD34FC5|nr:hypothetical protein [Nocardioides sp. W7]